MSERIYCKPNEIPRTFTCKLWVNYGIGKYNNTQLSVDDSDYEGHDRDFARVNLLATTVTFELPECQVDVKNAVLKILQKQRSKIMAENHRRLKDVDDEIKNLLALEYAGQS